MYINSRQYLLRTITILALFISYQAVCAPNNSSKQSVASLIDFVKDFANQAIKVEDDETLEVVVGAIDPRLTLRKCSAPLEGFLPSSYTGNNVSIIGVRCPATVRWSLYIPVKVKIMAPIVISAHPILRKEPLTADSLAIGLVDRSLLRHGYYKNINEITGNLAKKTIAPHTPIMPNMLITPKLVAKGMSVTILARNSSLEVRTKGIALANGLKGDLVKVRNARTKRILDAVVIDHGKVEVPL